MKLIRTLLASLALLLVTAVPAAAKSDYSFFFSTAPMGGFGGYGMGVPAYSDYFSPYSLNRYSPFGIGSLGMGNGFGGGLGSSMGSPLTSQMYAPTYPYQTYSGMNMNFPLAPMPTLNASPFGFGTGSGYYSGMSTLPTSPNMYGNGAMNYGNPYANGLGNLGGMSGYGAGVGAGLGTGFGYNNGFGAGYGSSIGAGCSVFVACTCSCSR